VTLRASRGRHATNFHRENSLNNRSVRSPVQEDPLEGMGFPDPQEEKDPREREVHQDELGPLENRANKGSPVPLVKLDDLVPKEPLGCVDRPALKD